MTVSDLANERLLKVLGLKQRAKLTPEAVVAEAKQVESLMETPGWAFLMELFEQREKRELTMQMAGNPSDKAVEYAEFMGYLKGLRELGQSAKAIAEYGKQLENELKQREVAGDAA